MILWGLIVGAFLGWCLADWESFGFVAGAILGALAGLGLRMAVRHEVAKAMAVFRAAREAPAETGARGEPSAEAPSRPDPVPREAPARVAADRPAIVAARPEREQRSVPPAVPPAPTIVDQALASAKNWLFGGNTIVRAGLVILFVGLSFLARWAAGAGLFPIELRLGLVAVAGIALLLVGFSRREARPAFALALQGAGVAVLYLTVFAAGPLFGVIPLTAAFVVMILVCVLGCALALLQDAQGMAAAAFVGGYAVPLLLGGRSSDMIVPFTYYTMLNLAVLVIAERRSWRIINLVGFFATFGVAVFWGVLRYDPAHYAVSQFFLIVSILIYVAAAILYARNTPGKLGNAVDSTLMFGPALAGFGLQAGLVKDMPFGAAYSALGFAALYLVLAAATLRYRRDSFRLLTESMIAIGVGFVTLAIPLALGVRWTSATWALEGAGAFWVGMRQARWVPRLFGIILQVVAALVFLESIDGNVAALPIANPVFIAALLIALPALAIAWWLRNPLPHSGSRWGGIYAGAEAALPKPAFLFGFLFWCLALVLEIVRSRPAPEEGLAPVPVFGVALQLLLTMLVLVVSAWGWAMLGRRTGWRVATWPSRVTLAVLVLAFFAQLSAGAHLLYTPNWIIWASVLALHYWMMRRNDMADDVAPGGDLRILYRATHVGSVWLLTALLSDCLWFWIDRGRLWNTSWSGVVWLLSGVAIMLGLTLWAGRANSASRREALGWPLRLHGEGYYWQAALPLAGLLFVGALGTALLASGYAAPLPYIPLLNPLDLTLALDLGALLLWRRMIVSAEPPPAGSGWIRGPEALLAIGALAFVILNTMWLRLAHHFFGVAWDGEALLENYIVETGLAILWTVLALGLMLVAHRRGQRVVWLAGAGLLALVVLKLFFVDLSNAGGGERIVTFIVVGVLMLVMGYFAPLPPKAAETSESGSAEERTA